MTVYNRLIPRIPRPLYRQRYKRVKFTEVKLAQFKVASHVVSYFCGVCVTYLATFDWLVASV